MKPTPESKPYQLNDLFWTLQGEGVHAGQRALFLRLPDCNYDCPWCDTEFNSYKSWSESVLEEFMLREPARLAIITGGEPLIHKDLPRLLALLKKYGFYVACETNGSVEAPAEIDFITTSPKAFNKGKHEPFWVHPEMYKITNQWKYVVDQSFDFALLNRHQEKNPDVIYALSPEFTDFKANTERIIAYIKTNPTWRLSLQTHKWINIP